MQFKHIFSFIFLTCLVTYIHSQNPISPPGIFLADPSAHVWDDGRLYIYGSLDESCNYYCSWTYYVLSTSDMRGWKIHNNAFFSKGEYDQVPYNEALLFAPDCAYRYGTYYLYYSQPDRENTEGVAVSSSPGGPFTTGVPIRLQGYNEIDPSVFIDDNGEAYYLWGQFSLKMARMNEDMYTLDSASIRDSILTEKEHHFHEGAFLAKHQGTYYLVYADISRADKPTCIGYAKSSSIFGPYKYGGVIIDNSGCNPGNWNNHGSIAKFHGQWYVFYHRSTHGCKTMRKACAEPIYFNDDGSIDEVEMTSQGAGAPLKATSRVEAEWACLLHGNVRMENTAGRREIISKPEHGDMLAFKYLDFDHPFDSVEIRYRSRDTCKIYLSIDKPWHRRLAILKILPDKAYGWNTSKFPADNTSGTHALWFIFSGKSHGLEIDWFRFD